MNGEELEKPERWAVQTFGTAELGDPRRTDRLVKMASALADDPAASLPKSMRNWGDTLATYRFLENEAITHEQIMAPHWMQTRAEAAQRQRVLLGADTTDMNLSSHETTTGTGPIGHGHKAQGFFVHTVLAMDADEQQLLGCMYQEPFVRQAARHPERRRRSANTARASRRCGNAASSRWEPCQRTTNGSMWRTGAAISTHSGRPVRSGDTTS